MRKTTLEIKKNYEKAGIVSAEDIEKICVLEEQYAEECEKIAEMCEEEGFPAHGSNYDLRCESVREYYDEADFKKMCQALEQGEHIKVIIECIGHTRNNNEQEAYKQSLVEKYGDKLAVNCSKGAYSYEYDYMLDAAKPQNGE